jgi:hypothetical protein
MSFTYVIPKVIFHLTENIFPTSEDNGQVDSFSISAVSENASRHEVQLRKIHYVLI